MITSKDNHLYDGNVNQELPKIAGATYVGRKWVLFKNIHFTPTSNPWRVSGDDLAHILEVKSSLEYGIDFKADLPILYVLPSPKIDSKGDVQAYGLNAGNHRLKALVALGYEGYWFDIIKVGEEGFGVLRTLTVVSCRENTSLPKKRADNDDIISAVTDVVNNNQVKNDLSAIREYVEECCPTFSKTRVTTIAKAVGARTFSTNDKFVNWNGYLNLEDTIKKNFDRASHGTLDTKRDEYGFTMLDGGYHIKGMYHVMSKFYDDRRSSYIIGHVRNPDSEGSLVKNRLSFLKNLENFEEMLLTIFEYYEENRKFPWYVEGFLPQNTGNEIDAINNGEILKFTIKELEKNKAKIDADRLSKKLGVSTTNVLPIKEDEDCDA